MLRGVWFAVFAAAPEAVARDQCFFEGKDMRNLDFFSPRVPSPSLHRLFPE